MSRTAPAGIVRPRSVLRGMLSTEAVGGLVLLVAAALALAVANGPFADDYFAWRALVIGPKTVLHWIDDGLMALFFMVVGLEIKRELIDGHLARWSDRLLPALAAVAGMAAPALVYLALAPGLPRGWAIPSATDIAFAIGVLALLGRRVPASLKLFLAAVAVVDDMGAVAIIALFYTAALDFAALAAAAAIFAVMLLLCRRAVLTLPPYLALAAGLWVAIDASGVHPSVAGVLAAFAIPIRRSPGRIDDPASPLHRLHRALEPWVAFGVVPLFGFANAGLSFAGIDRATLLAPLTLGVALGLFVGKQAGVFLAVRLAVAAGVAGRPAGANWGQVYGVALLCGIGFTMSLFIGGLAFDGRNVSEITLGVLAGSMLSALTGFAVLYKSSPNRPKLLTISRHVE